MRKNIVFANLPVTPFLKGPSTFPDFRMQTWRENAKKSVRDWENLRHVPDEKKQQSQITDFLSCNTFLF